MNWDFFNGFLAGAVTLFFVGIAFIWSIDEKEKDDDIRYEPLDDDHIRPA